MKHKILSLVLLGLVCSIGNVLAETTLFSTNFSTADGWGTTTDLSSGSITINGTTISYKNGGTVTAAASSGSLSFGGSSNILNQTSVSSLDYYIAIPVSNIVGGTVTVSYTTSSGYKMYYTYSDGSTTTCASRSQATVNNTFTITGLTNSSVTIYMGTKSKSMTSLIITTPETHDLSASQSYEFYMQSSSDVAAASLIEDASLPSYISMKAITSADNGSSNTSSISTPIDFSGIGTSKYYRLKPGTSSSIVIGGLSHVKSIRVYGNGSGSTGKMKTTVSKISGSGTAMTVGDKDFANSKTSILEYSTGDLTELPGYHEDTYYLYTITFTANFSLWGLYIEYATPATPTLTATWKVGGDVVTSGEISIDGTVPELSLDVSSSNSTDPSGYYSVTYASDNNDVVEITGGGTGFNLKSTTAGTATLTATVKTTDNTKYLDAAETYSYSFTVNRVDNSNLAITPAAGTYVGKATISMSYEDGYTVYYTTDGSDPETNPNSTRQTYSAPFDLASTATIKAIAYIAAQGYGNLVERSYTINSPATPSISASGLIAAGTNVTISTTDDDATIYYTLDGTDPSENGASTYSSALTINNPCTLKAVSKVNGVYSELASSIFTVKNISTSSYEFVNGSSTSPSGTSFEVPSGGQDNNTSVAMVYNNDGDGGGTWTINETYYQGKNNPTITEGIPTAGAYIKLSPSESGTIIVTGYSGGAKTYKACDEDGSVIKTGTTPASGNSYNIEFEVVADKDYYVYVSGSKIMFQKLSFEKVSSVSGTIGATGYTTFSSSYPLDLSNITGGTAYYASAADDVVTITSTEATVSAGEGLIIKGIADAEFTIDVATSGTAISGNLLVGCPSATVLSAKANHYVLVNNSGTAEFQSLATNGATIPAGKAYLAIPAVGSAPSAIRIVEAENNATAIENLDENKELVKFVKNGQLYIRRAGVVYDALGRVIR